MTTQRHGNHTKSCKTIPSCTRCSKQKRGPSELLSSLKELRHFAGAPHQHPQHVLKVFRKKTEFAWGQVGYRRLCNGVLDTEGAPGSIPDRKGGTVASLNLFMDATSKKTVTYFFTCFYFQGREHTRRCFGGKWLLAKCSKPLC